jgi:phosphatidylglycerophosphatase C
MSSDNGDLLAAGQGRPRLVVFDFDNTLYAGDSGTQLVTWLIRQNWWRVIAAVLISPVIAPLWLCADTRRRAISTYLWIGTVGAGCGEISDVIDQYNFPRPQHLQALEM